MNRLTANDRKETLQDLENQFRQDLAVHLYSTVLLRRIDPIFPNSRWSSWPLPYNQVPIPKSTKKYSDISFDKDSYETDIDVDKFNWRNLDFEFKIRQYELGNKPLPKYLLKYKQQLNNEQGEAEEKEETGLVSSRRINFDDLESDNDLDSIEVESESEMEMEIIDGNEIYTSNSKQKIENFDEVESITNSKLELLNEIYAIIEKKIAQKVSNSNGLTMACDCQTDITKKISKKIARKIDRTINNLADMPIPQLILPLDRKNWQNVFLASIDSTPTQSIIDTSRMKNLYHKLEDMFENIKYKYELEESDPNFIISSTGFDVAKYLTTLAQTNSKYTSICNSYFARQRQKRIRSQGLKNVIFDRLNTIESYKQLDWNNRNVKSIIHNTEDLDELKAKIINHERIGIDSSTYLLGPQFEPKRRKKNHNDSGDQTL